jgi:hypothetical protein
MWGKKPLRRFSPSIARRSSVIAQRELAGPQQATEEAAAI